MASIYQSMSDAELAAELERLEAAAQALRDEGLKLDMARGKPSPEQTGPQRELLRARRPALGPQARGRAARRRCEERDRQRIVEP